MRPYTGPCWRVGGRTAAAERAPVANSYLQPSDLDRLNVIHVTGTKGKGSTCAFTDSILRTLAPSARVGLYTSPHLVAVRERIRINGKPIEEEMFARYFFEVWEKLEQGPKVRLDVEDCIR